MSESEKDETPQYRLAAIVSALLVVSLIGGVIYYGLREQAAYEQDAKNQTADWTKHAAEKIEQSCPVLSRVKRPECVAKAKTEYQLEAQQRSHDAADLVAQRKAALWTGIMGIAALIGMALSALGVALVWITFREQRRTNNIAKSEADQARVDAVESAKHAEAALKIAERNAKATDALVGTTEANARKRLRAYVTVDTFTQQWTIKDRKMVDVTINVVFINTGESPARINGNALFKVIRKFEDPAPGVQISVVGDSNSPLGRNKTIKSVDNAVISADELKGAFEKTHVISLYFGITYCDVFGDEWYTKMMVEVIPRVDPSKPSPIFDKPETTNQVLSFETVPGFQFFT